MQYSPAFLALQHHKIVAEIVSIHNMEAIVAVVPLHDHKLHVKAANGEQFAFKASLQELIARSNKVYDMTSFILE